MCVQGGMIFFGDQIDQTSGRMTTKAGQVQVASKQIIKWSKTSGKLSASPWRDAKQEEDLLIFIIFSDQFDQKINILIYLSIYLSIYLIED